MNLAFKEEQKYTQWWIWVILVGIGIIPIVGIYKQVIKGNPFGDKPMSDSGLIVFSIFVYGFIAAFWLMKLKTEIDQNEIRMYFFPFVKKRVFWENVKVAKLVKYGFVGGWGIRYGTNYGTIYNIKGNKGLAIELTNGKKFLIGTQKEKQLQSFILQQGLKSIN